MPEPPRPTIFALSSGHPPAAIAVVRISGPRAGVALTALIGKLPAPRRGALARVRDPRTQEPIDEALALWFPAPHSETGEDVAELQLHGGRAVIAATFAALSTLEGFRPAEAGEFTRRAFENGKLDLTAVEGLADLVAAETQGQRRQALRQMQGMLGARAESWRERLIRALALTEARIDFSDEADVPEDLLTPALAIARSLADEIAGALADGRRGERLREGLTVAIAGPPNAGKSTLLNRIARREAAIVSPYAGTTRDVIEVHLDLDGWPVTLLDTAGIRESDDPVEMEGVRRARERAAGADLVLWVVEAGAADSFDAIPGRPTAARQGQSGRTRNSEGPITEPTSGFQAQGFGRPRNDEAGRAHSGSLLGGDPSGEKLPGPPIWLIRNKVDLLPPFGRKSEPRLQQITRTEPEFSTKEPLMNIVSGSLTRSEPTNESVFYTNEIVFNLSAITGEGFDTLFAQLARHASDFLGGAEPALVTRERQRRILGDALAALRRALAPDLATREDLLAEELRLTARTLGRLTGRVDVEDILDVIFRDFCIGK